MTSGAPASGYIIHDSAVLIPGWSEMNDQLPEGADDAVPLLTRVCGESSVHHVSPMASLRSRSGGDWPRCRWLALNGFLGGAATAARAGRGAPFMS
jgi:hypothetical protein